MAEHVTPPMFNCFICESPDSGYTSLEAHTGNSIGLLYFFETCRSSQKCYICKTYEGGWKGRKTEAPDTVWMTSIVSILYCTDVWHSPFGVAILLTDSQLVSRTWSSEGSREQVTGSSAMVLLHQYIVQNLVNFGPVTPKSKRGKDVNRLVDQQFGYIRLAATLLDLVGISTEFCGVISTQFISVIR